MAIKVFLSYINKTDGEFAKALKEELEETGIFDVFMVPKESTTLIENAEKIARYIDFSQYFISIYSSEAAKSDHTWLDQELGYAFNHYRNGFLKIIILTDNRDVVKGFIDSKIWDMSIKLEKENVKEVARNVRETIFDDITYPLRITITYVPTILNKRKNEQNFRISVGVENLTEKDMDNVVIDFIVPIPLNVLADKTAVAIKNDITIDTGRRIIEDPENTYGIHSNTLPFYYKKKVMVLAEGINRTTMHLKRLHAFNLYDTNWHIYNFNIYKNTKYLFVVVVKVPLFGLKFYQGIFKYDAGSNRLESKLQPIENDEMGKIEIAE
ncbi:MAG: hypothetical protein DRN40_07285 [Thermoplasmata archaeon]|nr:MAG: hypothetical protein DRN40_07285 [Thermoplasmata archaeon]